MFDDNHEMILKCLYDHILTGCVFMEHEYEDLKYVVESDSSSQSSTESAKPSFFIPDLFTAMN